jgi:ubiquinone/menaquinone biosynthesis C-methylase UbiE
MIEISVPPSRLLRVLYLFYLKVCIPLLGALLLGNPENYRLLGVYTERFVNCQRFAAMLERSGLEVHYHSHFAGCATSVSGSKPRAVTTRQVMKETS